MAKAVGLVTCTRCNEPKHRSQFKSNHNKRNGLNSWCKPCSRLFVHLRKYRKQGLDSTVYSKLLTAQDNLCCICRKKELYKRGTLAIDHDKLTGKIRGLLCSKCNLGIGLFNHDSILLIRAAQYLEEHLRRESKVV